MNFNRFTSRGQGRSTATTTSPPSPNGSDTPNVDGRVDAINSSEYAERCRKIMTLYQDLRALGVHVNFDLPRVVVIGDQSSGKSSLVEAVTGINVPRDSGTCTRCPMECTMSSDAESWSCSIELRNEFGLTGSPSPRVETTQFTQIHDKSQMELAIRRAQAAILSPHKEPSYFLRMTATQLKDFMTVDPECLKFSKNVVQINVRDPEVTDLSFVDLPGLIHNAETSLIAIVRQLVEHYIEGKKNTLVVIAMPMTDDYEKMEAVRLAKEPGADPDGSRTIGVLTKPDLLIPGSTNARKAWKDVLDGKLHQTTHGYFCVRLPDDEQRANGITKARMDEFADEFFNSTQPWDGVLDRSRFGIPNLVKYTSKLLINLIQDYLPELARAVDVELARCRFEIDELPCKSTEAPRTIIMLSITAFCQDIFDMVFGNKEKHFVQSNRALYSEFKQEIIATTPDFRPSESPTEAKCLVTKSSTEARSLQDVRQVIKRCITWELPKHIPFEATKILILQYTSFWSTPAIKCFDGVVQKLNHNLEDLLERHFGQYFHLEKYVANVTFEERDYCRGEAMVMLRNVLDFETNPVFTQNSDLFNEQERHWISSYTNEYNAVQSRLSHAAEPVVQEQYWAVDNAVQFTPSPPNFAFSQSEPVESFPPTPTFASSPKKQKSKKNPKPKFLHTFPRYAYDPAIDGGETTWTVHDELKVMANVQTYFQVAHKRILDYVPLAIEHKLNQNFAKKLQNTLIDTIFKDEQSGRVNLEGLLDEDPVIAKQRADLQDRISGLNRTQQRLDEFWRSGFEGRLDNSRSVD